MSKPLPELGTIVFLTDGGGMPLPNEGIWEVWSTDPDAEYPVELRLVTGDDNELTETTQYRITPVLDHVVVDPAAIREDAERERDEARAQLKAEQDANRKVVEKLCKAMGRWEGCWDNAAAERLAAGCDCPGNCPHCGLEIA